MIQPQLEQPIVAQAPADAMTIRRFIELVEQEEARYPLAEQQNTRLMITRLRKIFYGKESWDEHLIPGASDVDAPYRTHETVREREELEVFGPNYDIVRKDYRVTDRAGQTPEIFGGQELRLEDGSFIDIGHVFAGLDALNFPSQVDGPGTVNITENVDAVTWVGDLGSVLAEVQLEYVRRGRTAPDQATKQAILDEYASPQDMLGNIDAYVIGSRFNIGATAGGMKVSQILRRHYLGAATTEDGNTRERRYSLFAAQVGLTGWDGSNFANEAEWIEEYTDEVNDAAALYVGANTEGIISFPARAGAALGMSTNAGARSLVRLFLQALKSRIAAEPPPLSSSGG